MKADVLGGTGSGTSTAGALLGLLIGEIRAKRKKIPANVVGIDTTGNASPRFEAAGVPTIKRARTLRDIEKAIEAAGPGAVVIVDDATEPYLQAVQSFLETANEFRKREAKGQTEDPNMTPGAWRAVNLRVFGATVGAANRVGADIVLIHKEGEVRLLDPDLGLVPGQGAKARGQSTSGAGSDLFLHCLGGLNSPHRYLGDRLLLVVSDAAYLATMEPFALRSIRSAEDWSYIKAGLKRLLQKSIVRIMAQSERNRKAWDELEEGPDLWPEAAHSSDQGEKFLIADEIDQLFAAHGLVGRSDAVQQAKARHLTALFRRSTLAHVLEDPGITPAMMRGAAKAIEGALYAEEQEARRAEEKRLAEIEAKVQQAEAKNAAQE